MIPQRLEIKEFIGQSNASRELTRWDRAIANRQIPSSSANSFICRSIASPRSWEWVTTTLDFSC